MYVKTDKGDVFRRKTKCLKTENNYFVTNCFEEKYFSKWSTKHDNSLKQNKIVQITTRKAR